VDSSRPLQTPSVLSRRALASIVLIEIDSGRSYALDGAGARMWELCDGSRTAEEIASVVASEYRTDVGVVNADLGELLGRLREEGLIKAA
jgi:pyrroloquinoline quinone biosynthesis protein D